METNTINAAAATHPVVIATANAAPKPAAKKLPPKPAKPVASVAPKTETIAPAATHNGSEVLKRLCQEWNVAPRIARRRLRAVMPTITSWHVLNERWMFTTLQVKQCEQVIKGIAADNADRRAAGKKVAGFSSTKAPAKGK